MGFDEVKRLRRISAIQQAVDLLRAESLPFTPVEITAFKKYLLKIDERLLTYDFKKYKTDETTGED